jgi:hypothetical protein
MIPTRHVKLTMTFPVATRSEDGHPPQHVTKSARVGRC